MWAYKQKKCTKQQWSFPWEYSWRGPLNHPIGSIQPWFRSPMGNRFRREWETTWSLCRELRYQANRILPCRSLLPLYSSPCSSLFIQKIETIYPYRMTISSFYNVPLMGRMLETPGIPILSCMLSSCWK